MNLSLEDLQYSLSRGLIDIDVYKDLHLRIMVNRLHREGKRCKNCVYRKHIFNVLNEYMYTKCNHPKHNFKIGNKEDIKKSVCIDFEEGKANSDEILKISCGFIVGD